MQASTFIYGPFNYRHSLNGGHSVSELWLVEVGHVWRRGTALPSSIKSLGFWVYTQQTASTLSVNIWEKEKVCLVWGCLRFSFLWLRRCPQFPVSVCQSGGRSERRRLSFGYQKGQCIATATKLKAGCLSHPNPRSPRTYYDIWWLELAPGSSRPHFPPHVCLWHVQILNGCFTVIAPVIILISGSMCLISVTRRLMFLSFHFSQAYSDGDQRRWSNQTIMQNHWTFWIYVQRQLFL